MQLYSRRQFLKTTAAGAIATSSWFASACGFFEKFDLLIVGGLIYDGSGRPGIIGDLGIKNGKITALGDLKNESANMSEDELMGVLKYPHAMVASDGSALAPTGVLRSGNPHPRSFGTFPRVLGKYARKEKLFDLAEAIRKITALPASALGITDRGFLQVGNYADVVIFDPDKVIDRAIWTAPHQYPEGIRFVLVNGEVVIDENEFSGKLAGRVLRGPFGA